MTDRDDINDGHAITHCQHAASFLMEAQEAIQTAMGRLEMAKEKAVNVGSDLLFDALKAGLEHEDEKLTRYQKSLQEVGK